MSRPLPRRIVFQGLSALGVAAVLAGCGGAEEAPSPAAESEDSPTPTEPSNAPPSRKEPKQPQAPEALAKTAEIPVGGGIVLTDVRIVITQPKRGDFQAFSAVCKHQGQTVGQVSDNTITCLYHGSQYDAATGAVTTGPATAGLDPVKITVKSGSIVRA